ncbi:ABC transporter ATP-binding protein [soil metagenome]
MSSPVLALTGASKRFGDVVAVADVSLRVEPGEVYALIGLNGAGKTTLIRMVLGMVAPTTGGVEVLGRRLPDRSVWAEVGYLVEPPTAYPELTVRENLEVVRRLRHMTRSSVVEEVIDRFGLVEFGDRRTRTLSQGNAQRLGLAKAFLHRPSLVILDEPVNALDPAGVVELRELLLDLARAQETTVLLSSHLLGEVSRAASRIAVLHEGHLVAELSADELASRMPERLEVAARDNDLAADVLAASGLAVRRAGDLLRLEDERAVRHPERFAAAMVAGGSPPTHVAVVEEDLEAYFLRLVAPLPARPLPARPARADRAEAFDAR